MALYPGKFTAQDRLQPGARGERFQNDFPGYREQGDRINRSNMKLHASEHDIPNIKYEFDYRLPVLFRYGWAHGFNQMVITKGRVVAVDPFMDLVCFDSKKQFNTLSLANGGMPVRLIESTDVYPTQTMAPTDIISPEAQGQPLGCVGREWTPCAGAENMYNNHTLRSFNVSGTYMDEISQLPADHSVDVNTGRVINTVTGEKVDSIRPGNIPIGIMQRNEYTRDDDAFNGIMPGPVMTDKLVELPWFTYKDKAEGNPWGSAYGALFPGALIKSDENGRVIVSPLSYKDDIGTMDLREYEGERQQVIGQVYAINTELVPAGAAKWATWALETRMNFDEFNPDVYRQNNRRGEDAINNSPYNSTGEYPGYPYDKAYKDSDLHMLASSARMDNYDHRMNPEYQYENLGIPGLTDGKNVAVRNYPAVIAAHINKAAPTVDYTDIYCRTIEVDVFDLEIALDAGPFVACTEGALLDYAGHQFIKIKYVDVKQGIIVLTITDKALADTHLPDNDPVPIKFKFKKRGLAGVPTFLDWDGCVGSVRILLQK